MRVLGVTGGTGAGKSMVTEMLREKGCEVIDADKIAYELEKPGTDVFSKMIEAFGKDILLDNGELNRKALSNIVFNDKEKRMLLNKIVHQGVSKEIKKRVIYFSHKNVKYVVLDVPIPVEEGFLDTANVVWAVVANNDLRIERIMERQGLTEEEAEARIASQMSNSEYERIADVTIYNERSLEDLKSLVDYEFKRTVEI